MNIMQIQYATLQIIIVTTLDSPNLGHKQKDAGMSQCKKFSMPNIVTPNVQWAEHFFWGSSMRIIEGQVQCAILF